MNLTPLIREITDADIDAVVALWHAAGVAKPWNDPLRDIAFARREAHSTVLVAEIEGRVAASVMVGEDGHRGWVYYVAADPTMQGGGLGRAMMAAAESWLVGRGVWKLQLLVRGDNDKVKRFYEHLGYADTKSSCFQKVIAP
ncbi:GNAT family acetyltransferase [Bosea sp. 685]|uniref:GNAT family acetyltransferase n=1 Tax=Bosea sp. 685 TaxID=3080057 RepID=UPI002892EE38|nr:GNAT family acetyltransferase [Bosea sp. 685]WNJ91260.1 GNAT family acetyltransferase [Bosea sp. 685]